MHIRLFSVKKPGICPLGIWTFVNRYFAAPRPYWGVLLARTGPDAIGPVCWPRTAHKRGQTGVGTTIGESVTGQRNRNCRFGSYPGVKFVFSQSRSAADVGRSPTRSDATSKAVFGRLHRRRAAGGAEPRLSPRPTGRFVVWDMFEHTGPVQHGAARVRERVRSLRVNLVAVKNSCAHPLCSWTFVY